MEPENENTSKHLEEVSTRERIDLVQDDKPRRYGQLIISGLLIAFAVGFLAWYVYAKADDAFLTMMATGMFTLLSAGVGASLAIYGLGRTVGRRQ